MKTFRCTHCQQVLYFESTRCVSCQNELVFLQDLQLLCAVQPLNAVGPPSSPPPSTLWTVLGDVPGAAGAYLRCRNQALHAACNWAVPSSADPIEAAGETPLCAACELNIELPDTSDPIILAQWQKLEVAKRRLLFSLTRLGLNYAPKSVDPEQGLGFAFRSDGPEKVFTGHANGIITINLSEADPSFREQTRERLGEAYRTVLGHFRHESGHYYWDRLIKDGPRLEDFRALFGDERADYAKALEQHYAAPPGATRGAGFVSAYAQMHPWEDWAETWAHYLHMVDTLETARAYGLSIERNVEEPIAVSNLVLSDFDELLRAWVPVTLALNSLNRSMGQPDPYPFTLDAGIIAKLRFVHEVISSYREGAGAAKSFRHPQVPPDSLVLTKSDSQANSVAEQSCPA